MPYFLKPNLYYYSWSILIAFTLSFNAYLVVYTFTLRASLRVSLFLFWRRKGNIVCAHTQTFSYVFNTYNNNFDLGQRKGCARTHNVCYNVINLRTYLTTTFCACVCFPLSERSMKSLPAAMGARPVVFWSRMYFKPAKKHQSFRSFWAGHNRWPSLLVQGEGHKWVSRFSSYFFS